jgi:DNA helicase-2/ATP-dependent DNA helicase PcrA
VIANNKNREDKKLVSDIKEGELVNIYIGDNKEKQWNFVISEIEKLKGEYSYRDIAILYRSKNETSLIENKFAVKKMPYKIFGGIKF